MIGLVVFTIMTTWRAGRRLVLTRLRARQWAEKGIKSVPRKPMPYPLEQGIFWALQGIKSGDQGNFDPDQGIRSLVRNFGIWVPTKPIIHRALVPKWV